MNAAARQRGCLDETASRTTRCRRHASTAKRSSVRASLIVTLGLCAFASSASPSAPTSPNEIQPGDARYPIENPHPTRLVQFQFSIPPSLAFRLQVTYRAFSPACQGTVGLGVVAPYFVSIPLQIIPVGGHSRGGVAIDRFQEGACRWGFSDVSYWVGNSTQGYNALATLQRRNDRNAEVDVWCMSLPTLSPQHPETCGPLEIFFGAADAPSKQELESLRSGGSHYDPPAPIGHDTTSIEVRFHDIDALRRAKARTPEGGRD
jgi:hypothetical protein